MFLLNGEHTSSLLLSGEGNDLDDVDRVPVTLRDAALGLEDLLLDEKARGEGSVIGLQVPQIDGGDSALIVKRPVRVKDNVHPLLDLAETVRGHEAVRKRRLVDIVPGAPVRISVAVVVAQQVQLARLVLSGLQRLFYENTVSQSCIETRPSSLDSCKSLFTQFC